MIVTRNLKTMLNNYNQTTQERIAMDILKLSEQLSELPSDLDRGGVVFELADEWLAIDIAQAKPHLKHPLPCKQGCVACCHQWVGASHAEGAVIWEYIKAHDIRPDFDALRWQSRIDDPDEYWKHYDSGGRCVFLNDSNLCNIYPVRPLTCRCYYVAEPDNKKCQPSESGGSQTVPVAGMLRAEMVISALANVEQNVQCSSMAALLIKYFDDERALDDKST